VEGTPFDFSKAKAIGTNLFMQAKNVQLQNSLGYDHNFALNKPEPGVMTLAAIVVEPMSGCKMEIFTEEPALQFYGGNLRTPDPISGYQLVNAFMSQTQNVVN